MNALFVLIAYPVALCEKQNVHEFAPVAASACVIMFIMVSNSNSPNLCLNLGLQLLMDFVLSCLLIKILV